MTDHFLHSFKASSVPLREPVKVFTVGSSKLPPSFSTTTYSLAKFVICLKAVSQTAGGAVRAAKEIVSRFKTQSSVRFWRPAAITAGPFRPQTKR